LGGEFASYAGGRPVQRGADLQVRIGLGVGPGLRTGTGLGEQVVPQKVNDADGQIGYLLRFFPQTTELSGKIVAALKAEGVSCGTRGSKGGPDWHHYSYMFPVVLKAPMAAGASPFTDPRYTKAGGKAEYHRGGCPVADDLYDRCVSVYLDQWFSPADCDNIAKAINKVLTAYCTPDPAAAKWQ